MSAVKSRYQLPPVSRNEQGTTRTVGFELEFSGITYEEAAGVLTDFTGSDLERKSAVECCSRHPELGSFSLEMDWTYLKNYASEKGMPVSGDAWSNTLRDAAGVVVPLEIVCPPIALGRFDQLDRLTSGLRQAGARGSEAILAAYGVHINPEIPRRDAETMLRFIKAFCLLEWWLADVHEVDFTRKLSTYVDLYPEHYLNRALATEEPDIGGLLQDYIEYNPTRNRALDLFPLFAYFDEKAVRLKMKDPRIKKRPTFHYRLPNCDINRADWSLAESWNPWVVVERLAAEPAGLAELGEAFFHRKRFLIGVHKQHWKDYVDRWLRDHSLV